MALTQISTNGIKNGTITGIDLATNVDLVDNQKIRLGTGSDLQIYHDGSESVIGNNTGTLQFLSPNEIRYRATTHHFISYGNDETMAKFIDDGSVELYYDNSKKLETTTYGALLTGNLKLGDSRIVSFGDSDDLQIYHNGSASYIADTGTGELILKSNSISFTNAAENEHLARFFQDSAVELYFNGSKKFHTKNAGVYITGDIETSGDLYMLDNEKIRIGHSQDLELYHDGVSSVIKNLTNDLFVQSIADVKLRTNDSELAVDCTVNGSVALYYDASKKLDTLSNGARVTGRLVVTGNYEADDNKKITLGNSQDLQIFHDGTNSVIQNNTGVFYLKTINGEFHLVGRPNGSTELYYDHSKQFETLSGGNRFFGYLFAGDNEKIHLGNSNDLNLFHNTYNYITYANNHLMVTGDGSNHIYLRPVSNEYSAKFLSHGAAELYYDNSIRIRTQSYGVEYNGQEHKFLHTNSGGVGAYLSLQNPGTAAGGKTGIVFGIGASNAILDGGDYGEGQIKCFTDSGLYGNLEFNLHVGANRSWLKIVGNGAGNNGAGSGTEGMRGGVAFGCAGIAIDRSWTGQPGIHVFNENTEGDTDQGTFRFHGWNRSYASYPASSGADFSVNLVADGSGLSSDERRKTGIATITNALDTITKMRGVSFQFVNRELDPQTHMSMDNGKKLGFIAQEVIPLLPQLILDSGEKNVPLENGWCDRYSMDYSGVTAVLVEAIKELAAKVASLESKITE